MSSHAEKENLERQKQVFDMYGARTALGLSRFFLPVLGWVKMREKLRFTGNVLSSTVSPVADRWFVSISVDISMPDHLPAAENQGVVGMDLGLSAFPREKRWKAPRPTPSSVARQGVKPASGKQEISAKATCGQFWQNGGYGMAQQCRGEELVAVETKGWQWRSVKL